MAPLVWFITGANTGFGLMLADLALSKGDTVIATARSLSKFPEYLTKKPNADLVETEVTASAASIARLVGAAVEKHGRIDILVNNAGFGHFGSVEEVSEEESRYQFDVNFFGLLNFTRAVIPHMRKQGCGVIVQLSSGVGILGPQGAPIYTASKFAVEGLSEAMTHELKPFGIRVHVVEPGVFRTDFLKSIAHGQNPGNPEAGVQRIYEIATGTGMATGLEDQLRFPLGSDCYSMLEAKISMLKETAEKAKSIALSTDY
ncbi:short chain dehydrognease/reductase [Trichoderma parareesei]|uniref:Short chain dehydrognease/reductase n=1 Tax=Trichoderma parareesei TaxID=858221 RepID=A0A2H2Z4D9_TRIPA|nr:short chain dehydrognease/reductase [Trichoderma parareesei]